MPSPPWGPRTRRRSRRRPATSLSSVPALRRPGVSGATLGDGATHGSKLAGTLTDGARGELRARLLADAAHRRRVVGGGEDGRRDRDGPAAGARPGRVVGPEQGPVPGARGRVEDEPDGRQVGRRVAAADVAEVDDGGEAAVVAEQEVA